MAAAFDPVLEPTRQDHPETTQVQHGDGQQQNPRSSTPTTAPPSTFSSQTPASSFSSRPERPQHPPYQHNQVVERAWSPMRKNTMIYCGGHMSRTGIACLVTIIVTFLFVSAVIGLAVTTSIMMRRASSAEARLADMSASLASALANLPTATATATATT